METDCDTLTSSWSCDEAPSVTSHSPGCAIVHQIPILNVTYTEQKCLQDKGGSNIMSLSLSLFDQKHDPHFGNVLITSHSILTWQTNV